MEEIKLTKEDWKEAKAGAISLYKNALAQVEVYKVQIEVAEDHINELEESENAK